MTWCRRWSEDTLSGVTSSRLPIRGAYRQAAKGSEDTLPRGASSGLPIGGARRPCCPSGEQGGRVARQGSKEAVLLIVGV